MADLRAAGQAWLTVMRKDYASVSITYTRGSGSNAIEVATTAHLGKTRFNVADGYGILTILEERDYLIEVADLVDDFTEPQRGDRIEQTLDDGLVHLFEVMAPNGEDVFKYHDQYRKVFRIHTKHVGTETT